MEVASRIGNDNIYTLVLASFVTIFLIYLIWDRFRNRNLPPGPIGLPLVGYLPFVTRKPHLKFQELRKKYGPIFSLRIGSRYVVVLADYTSIKDAFLQDAFIGRPPDSIFELNKETLELQAIHGIKWKEQRRFMLHTLRNLGLYKDTMERHIREEICELLERLMKEVNHPVAVSKFLATSTSNNISSLIFGTRRSFEDPIRMMMDKTFSDVGRNTGQVAWQSFFPWIKAAANFLGFHNTLSKSLRKLRDYFRVEVKEHRQTLNPNNMRDFIDGYLMEIQKKSTELNTTFKEPVLINLIGALFGAGSNTVRLTLDWLLLISAAWPDVQGKVHSEIDDVIGKQRLPNKTDMKLMPYTETVMLELLRWRSILPINLLRYTLEDTQLGEYFIPKNSYVLANLWGVLHDPDLWGNDAEDFKPERFLSSDGKTIEKPDYFIPFSIGKRQCPGEPLALFETFLYFTAILQKFEISLPEGATPDFEGQLALSLSPKPYELCLKLR